VNVFQHALSGPEACFVHYTHAVEDESAVAWLVASDNARFLRKTAGISALTAFAANRRIANSRRIMQFECPNLSEKSLVRERQRRCWKRRPFQLLAHRNMKARTPVARDPRQPRLRLSLFCSAILRLPILLSGFRKLRQR
jgi:predicted RNA-binding Zn-ribbon protein involved in translation (DUF1610 family)